MSDLKVCPGIAIITYRRPAYLRRCIENIFKHTKERFEIIVASDEWNDKKTLEICDKNSIKVIRGPNRGVVWNKNRGLFYFMNQTKCDPIILIEDDTYPVVDGWLDVWVKAAERWQHVNHTVPALLTAEYPPLGGEGTPEDPYVHTLVTGQCTAVTRRALETAGYLDTRFQGYGHGHVEWTKRHITLVPGARDDRYQQDRTTFISIVGGLKSEDAPSFRNQEDVDRNGRLLKSLSKQEATYQPPWKDEGEERLLVAEVTKDDEVIKSFLERIYARGGKEDPESAEPSPRPRGCVDRIYVNQDNILIEGWAMDEAGNPLPDPGLVVNNKKVEFSIERKKRLDVKSSIPSASDECGLIFKLKKYNDIIKNGGYVYISRDDKEIAGKNIPRQYKDMEISINKEILINVNLSGKSLYFGSLYEHEPQFLDEDFIGLALVPRTHRDTKHNVYDPLPAADATVPRVQAQDVFEHLERERIPGIFDEVYRVLKQGGVFRLSVPDYRSPLLKKRSVYDENGHVIADLMMGGAVTFDANSHGRKVAFLQNGNAHLWFPTYEEVQRLILNSRLRLCRKITTYHAFLADGSVVCDPIPDKGMHVMRAPPNDMRSGGKPVSIVIDFEK